MLSTLDLPKAALRVLWAYLTAPMRIGAMERRLNHHFTEEMGDIRIMTEEIRGLRTDMRADRQEMNDLRRSANDRMDRMLDMLTRPKL